MGIANRIEGFQSVSDVGSKMIVAERFCSGSHDFGCVRHFQQIYTRFRELIDLTIFYEYSAVFIDHLWNSPRARSDAGFPICHRFKIYEAETFHLAGESEYSAVCILSTEGCVVDVTHKFYRLSNVHG